MACNLPALCVLFFEVSILLLLRMVSSKGLFGIVILISAILKIVFLKIVYLKSPLFKIAQVFGKTC